MKPEADRELDAELRRTAAVEIARRLAADPELRWAYDEAAQIAQHGVARAPHRARFAIGGLGWSVAGLALAGVGLYWTLRGLGPPQAELALSRSRAAAIVAAASAADPVVLLQGRVVVDANSVAVLPFATLPAPAGTTAGDPSFAAELQRSVAAELAAVPGLYVVRGRAVLPYVEADLSPAEIGVLLGARGIFRAGVERSGARVRVQAELSDAATNAVIWRADYERPIDELRAIQVDVIDGVATALVNPVLRALAAGTVTAARSDSVLATIPEPVLNE